MDREFLLDLFASFGPVTLRKMFSGFGISVDGVNFAMALRAGLIFRADELTVPYYHLRLGKDGARERVDEQLARLDALLAAQPYLGGAEFGLADIAYVPWLLRARDSLGVSFDAFTSLSDWLARLEQRPAIAAEAEIVAAL